MNVLLLGMIIVVCTVVLLYYLLVAVAAMVVVVAVEHIGARATAQARSEDRAGSGEQTRHGAGHGISKHNYASSDCARFHGAARAGLHERDGGTESGTRAHRQDRVD